MRFAVRASAATASLGGEAGSVAAVGAVAVAGHVTAVAVVASES